MAKLTVPIRVDGIDLMIKVINRIKDRPFKIPVDLEYERGYRDALTDTLEALNNTRSNLKEGYECKESEEAIV